jgi:DNA-binding NarL/FixJ family response regulator
VSLALIRILIVDDFKPWRDRICSMLSARPELQVIFEASDGLDAVQRAEELQPDLILLDINLPGLNGIEVARRIRKLASKPRILFLSQYDSLDVVHAALSTGAEGYVVKARAGRELLPAIEAVMRSKRFVSRLAEHDFVLGTHSA